MAKVAVNETSLSSIADAIRMRNGSIEKYKPAEMAEAINNLTSTDTDYYNLITGQTKVIDIPYEFSDNGVITLGGYAFTSALAAEEINVAEGITVLQSLVDTENLGHCPFQSVGWESENGCALNLPSTLTTIGESMFYSFNGNGELVLPQSLTTIKDSAFESADNLTDELVIPANVKTIGERAFYNANNCTNIYFKGIPESIGYNAFHLKRVASDNVVYHIYVPWSEGAGPDISIHNQIEIIYDYVGQEVKDCFI